MNVDETIIIDKKTKKRRVLIKSNYHAFCLNCVDTLNGNWLIFPFTSQTNRKSCSCKTPILAIFVSFG